MVFANNWRFRIYANTILLCQCNMVFANDLPFLLAYGLYLMGSAGRKLTELWGIDSDRQVSHVHRVHRVTSTQLVRSQKKKAVCCA